jgi:hypothetical protein
MNLLKFQQVLNILILIILKMKFTSNLLKTFLLLFILCLATPISTFEKTRFVAGMQKFNKRVHSNVKSTHRRHHRSAFKSKERSNFSLKALSKTHTSTKDPVTLTIFVIVTIIKIASAVLDHYIQKNYRLTLQAMQQEYESNKNNAEILRSNEMRSCSSMKLLLRVTKHLYLVAKFKLFYSERYLEFRKTQKGGEKIAHMMQQISEVQKEIKDVYPQILKNIIANVKTVCEDSILGDDLVERNNALKDKIQELEYKLSSQESNMIMSMVDSVLSDMTDKKEDLVGLQFKFQTEDPNSEPSAENVESFAKQWTKYANVIKSAKDFKVLMGDLKEFYKSTDKDSVSWLKIISKLLTFLGGITSTTGNFIPDPTTGTIMSGVSCIVTFVAVVLDFIANIIDYKREENLVIKKQKRKQLWSQFKTLLFQAAKCVSTPISEALESTVNLVIKILTLIESKKALEKELRDKAFYEKKGEIEIEISKKFQTYYQCEMRHFTVQLFYEIFKDALVLDEEVTKEGGNAEKAWTEILSSVSSREILKTNLEELCNENIQFCSRTFSEAKLTEVGFSAEELNSWKNQAINGPYSDIAVTDSNEAAESFIQLGYEPIHSFVHKSKVSASVITILGCRLCSKKYVIRYMDLFENHHEARKAFNKNPDNIGDCKSSSQSDPKHHLCKQVFNDDIVTNSKLSPCNTRFKTIRFHPLSEKGVIGYEKVSLQELTAVTSSTLIVNSMNLNPNGSTSRTYEIHKNYSVWSKSKSKYYDCSNYKNNLLDASQENIFESKFCSPCTKNLYATPPEQTGYLSIEATNQIEGLKVLHKASFNSYNNVQILKNMNSDTPIPQYLSFKLQDKQQSSFMIKDTTKRKELIGLESDYTIFNEKRYHEYTETCRYDIKMMIYSKSRHDSRFEDILFQKENYNWIVPSFNEYVYKINNAKLNRVSVLPNHIDETNNSHNEYNREVITYENDESKFIVYSFKPFDVIQEAQNGSISRTQQSSDELCADICDETKNICSYHYSRRDFKLSSSLASTLKKDFSEFTTEKDGHFKLSFEIKNVNPKYCFEVGNNQSEIYLKVDNCDDSRRTRQPRIEDIDSTIIIALIKNNNDKFMKAYREKGYEMIITPDFNQSLISYSKQKYFLRVLVKFLPSRGFLPFYDYLNSEVFYPRETCKNSLIKEQFLPHFWPDEFKNIFDNNENYKVGFAPLKMLNVLQHHGEYFSIEDYINTSNNHCQQFNIFLPKLFNKNSRPSNQEIVYKKIEIMEDKIYEQYSSTGPGIRAYYWLQISNTESLFNDVKLLEDAWKYNYVPLQEVTSKDGKIKMRAWVTYNFEIFNDKKSLCDRCLKDRSI